MISRNTSLLSFCLTLALSCTAYAKQAQMLLYPTRIVLEKNESNSAISLKNNGDGIGNYSIELVDMVMKEEGIAEEVPLGQAEHSLHHIMRVAPQSVSLQPGEDQNIRLMIRKPRDLAEGEYRSHLKITLVDDDANQSSSTPTSDKALGIAVKTRFATIIPVIIRHGSTSYAVQITGAKIRSMQDESGKQIPLIDIDFIRKGNRSSMGDIEVTYKPQAGGKETVIKSMAGIAIYRSTEKRKVTLQLDIPDGVTLGKGSLHVTYRAQESEGNGMIAEGEFPL